MTDYGFELLSDELVEVEDILQEDILTTQGLVDDIMAGINAAELAQRRFRDIARIAGLTFEGMPGKKLKTRQLQASSRIFFKVFQEYEPNNLLLRQAYEEVLYDQLEETRLRDALNRIAQQKIVIRKPERFTPLSFPIMVERIRGKLTSESIEDRVNKMLKQLTKQKRNISQSFII
jgi:ATP-dependent Lhr-like helicase